jgi:Ammonium Transporter Family
LGKRHIALLRHVDDVLDVFHTHLIASVVGGFLTGIFATEGGTGAFGNAPTGGAIDRYGHVVWVQIVAALFVIGWNVFWTSAIMAFIKYVLRIPLRMSDEHLMVGDYAVHEEESYTFAYYNRSLINNKDEGQIIGMAPPEEGKPLTGKMQRERAAGITHAPPGEASIAPEAVAAEKEV